MYICDQGIEDKTPESFFLEKKLSSDYSHKNLFLSFLSPPLYLIELMMRAQRPSVIPSVWICASLGIVL